MALDTRIPLMSQTFDLASIEQSAQQGRLQDLKLQSLRQGMANKSRLQELLPRAMTGDKEARGQAMAIDPDLASTFSQMDKRQLEQVKQRNQVVGRLAAGVMSSENPQAAYQNARQYAIGELGISPDQVPEEFDPAFMQNAINQARTVEDMVAKKEREFQIKSGVDPQGRPGFFRVSPQGGPAQRVEGVRPVDAKQTERDKEIRNLIERGVPEEWAQDVASGNVNTQVDQFGNVIAINRATGEVRTLRGSDQEQGQVDVGMPRQPGEEGGLYGAVEEGSGPFAAAQSAISNVIGPFWKGAQFPETEGAKTQVRLFNQQAKTSLVNNPRFPVAEQKLIQRMLPDVDTVFTAPEIQRERLDQLHSFLTNKLEQNQISIDSGRVTQKERGDLSNQNEAIRRVLNMMGSPEQGGDIGSMSRDQLQNLDASNMSDEDLQRAADRWEELNAQ